MKLPPACWRTPAIASLAVHELLKNYRQRQASSLFNLTCATKKQVIASVEDVLGKAGRIDIVINNAGISLAGPVEATSTQEARALFNTNVFGVRVVLVEPSFTNTNLDTKARRTAMEIGAYANVFSRSLEAVLRQIKTAPAAEVVAEKILKVIQGPYRLRQPADGRAKLLSMLRRFAPAGRSKRASARHSGFESRLQV